MNLTPDLCIAARNLLRLTRGQLADQTGISAVTLKMFESNLRQTEATRKKLITAFYSYGVTFKDRDGVRTITHEYRD